MATSTDDLDRYSDDELRAMAMGMQPALAAGEPTDDELRNQIRGDRPVTPSVVNELESVDMSTTPPSITIQHDNRPRISPAHKAPSWMGGFDIPPVAVGAVKGMSDFGNTALNALDIPAQWLESQFGTPVGPTVAQARNLREQSNRDYEAEFGDSGQALLGRIGGELALTAPVLARAMPMMAARMPAVSNALVSLGKTGRLGRVAQLATQGGAAGGLGGAMVSGGYEGPISEQIRNGVIAGMILNPVLTPAIGGVAAGAKWLGQKLPNVNPLLRGRAAPPGAPAGAPAAQGAPPTAGAPVATPGSPAAPPTMPANPAPVGPLSAEQAARKANLEAFGVKPTRSMITRNELEWANEAEAAKHSQDLMGRARENSDALRGALNQVPETFGGSSNGAYDAGDAVLDFVKTKDVELKQAVTAAYGTVRKKLGDTGAIELSGLDKAKAPLAVETEGKPITEALDGWLRHIKAVGDDGKPARNLTVKEAEEVRKFISRQGADNDSAERVRELLIDSLDEDVKRAMGSDPFDAARALHAERKTAIEASRVLRQVNDKKFLPGDDFIDRHIVAKSVKPEDIRKLTEYLTTGTPEQVALGEAALADLRRETARWISTGAVKGGTAEQGVVSYPSLAQRLKAIGPEKLRALFGEDVAGYYRRLLQAAHDVEVAPPKSPINRSNTAAQVKKNAGAVADKIDTAANVLGMASGHPYIGGAVSLASKGVRVMGERSARKSQEKMIENALLGKPHAGDVPTDIEPNPLLRGAVGGASGGVSNQR